MVYKRYIKRRGKTFGPYYYESYRDKNGRVKTRYIESPLKEKKELHYNKTPIKTKNLVIFLIIFCLVAVGILLYLNISSLTGKVSLGIDENYGLNQNLTGEISVLIEQGDKIQKDTEIILRLNKDGQTLKEELINFESFFEGILIPIEINETIEECKNITHEEIVENCSFSDFFNETINETQQIEICENQTSEQIVENCTNITISDYYFNQQGDYSRDIENFFIYSFTEIGDYSFIFSIPLLNISFERSFSVEETPAENRTIGILSTPGDIGGCQFLNVSGAYSLIADNTSDSGVSCFQLDVSADSMYDNIALNGQGHIILGNFSANITGFSVALMQRENITIQGLVLSGFAIGIRPGGTNWTIFNNTIYSSILAGIGYLRLLGPVLDSSSIKSNTIYNSTIGIYIDNSNSKNISVEDNILYNNTYGIYVSGDSNNFSGGRIIDSVISAIYVNASNNIFSNINITNSNLSSFDLVIVASQNNTLLIDQNIGRYNFSGLGNNLIIQKTGNGQIKFLTSINGTGQNLSYDIQIGDNFAFVNSSQSGLNKSANITFYNLPTNFVNPRVLKDGVNCSDCYNFTSLNAGEVIFNVSSWSNYSIGNDGYCGDSLCNNVETCSTCAGDCGVCSVTPSGGGGGSSCKNTCTSLKYECGNFSICNKVTNCGPCLNGTCNNGKCISNCSENWQCSNWGICSNNQRNRTCFDLNNCTINLTKPVEIEECNKLEMPLEDIFDMLSKIEAFDFGGINSHSSGGGVNCISNYECSDWFECDVKPVFEDLISGVQKIKGKQSRICIDKNLCKINKKEYRECSIKVKISLNKSNFCDNEYIEIYNQETGELVSRINNKKQSLPPSLDISFITGNAVYCDSCFNGIMDGEELGIDCGGICADCDISEEISFSPEEIKEGFFIHNKSLIINLMVLLLMLILSFALFLLNNNRDEIDDLIFIGRRHLKSRDFDNANKTYLYLKHIYEHNYFGNKEVYNKIREFYQEILNYKK